MLEWDQKVIRVEFSLFQGIFPFQVIESFNGKYRLHVSFLWLIDDSDEIDPGMVEFNLNIGIFLRLFVAHSPIKNKNYLFRANLCSILSNF